VSDTRTVLEVAWWEFRRFVKPRQQLITLLLTLVGGGVGWGVSELGKRNRPSAEIAVIGVEHLPVAASPDSSLTFVPHRPDEELALRKAVGRRELGGLLLIRGADTAELVVAKEPTWRSTLERALAAARQRAKLQQADLAPEALADLLAPPHLDVTFHEAGRGPTTQGARLVAMLAAVFVILGVFTGAAYVFASVTGEKQQRVTEQIVSTIPSQAWIDGKILGLSAVSLVSVLNMAAAVVLLLVGRSIARGGGGVPPGFGDPWAIVLTVVFTLLGFLFWLSFVAAVAATVDDPHTSTRAPLMFIPALCGGPAGFALGNPDSVLVRVLGVFPLTSWAVAPVRLALTDVQAWEVVLAIALLVAGIWVLRRMAGTIFRSAMLMYGKEPSWREMRRWMREA